jgi:allantoate deiminase
MTELDSLTDTVLARCDELARFSESANCLTRRFLTPPMHRVHDALTRWMLDAGLQVRVDAVGNLMGRHAGETGKVFLVGSHIDSVPNAGKFDGTLGVLIAIAAAQALASVRLKQHLDVIAFSEEEGVRFRTPYLGSLAVCGDFDSRLLTLIDPDGKTLAEAISDFGLNPAAIPAAAYAPGALSGYLEAHIEQGPVLEAADHCLGTVSAIAGQSRRQLTFVGKAGHAGTSPMNLRRDALTGAAEFITALEQLALATPGLRATVGQITVSPGAGNVIAGEACLSLDVRHAEDNQREAALNRVLRLAQEIASRRRLGCLVQLVSDQPAAPCDSALTTSLASVVKRLGYLASHGMVSGAGHDAAILSRHCPATMLFLRSPGGVSHHPDETVRREDVRAALDVMIQFLRDTLAVA